MCLFHFPICFEQPSAHHQENQLYQYIIWYISLCVGDCLVCRYRTWYAGPIPAYRSLAFNIKNMSIITLILLCEFKTFTSLWRTTKLFITVQIPNFLCLYRFKNLRLHWEIENQNLRSLIA